MCRFDGLSFLLTSFTGGSARLKRAPSRFKSLNRNSTRRSFGTNGVQRARTVADWPSAKDPAARELREVIDGLAHHGIEQLARPVGLFGQPALSQPTDLVRLARQTQERASVLVDQIERTRGTAEIASVVRNLDRLSDMLCQVIDMAEFVRTAHPREDWRASAQSAHQLLCSYMNVLNTNRSLYETLEAVVRDGQIMCQLSSEGKRVAQAFLHDFESSAIHLPDQERRQFVQLSDEILSLSTAFQHNLELADDRPSAKLRREWLVGIPNLPVSRNNGDLEVSADDPVLLQILRYCTDARAREVAYRTLHSSGARQKKILELLLLRRSQLARLAGYDTYAHMVLRDKMAKCPENVIRFLGRRISSARPGVMQEASMLTRHPLQPWDRDFLAHQYASRWLPSPAPISHYFSVGTVFSGLSLLWSRLFGMHLQLARAAPGETWSEDVLKLEVMSEDAGGRVGIIYADLWSRAGKPPGAAHFTIRCSRRIDLDDSSVESSLEQHGARTRDRPGVYQQPIVALLCDFRRPSSTEMSFMQWHEIETLFHEMGHALHSMVGRTEFQNVSGTRCATDFVEVPSILMEYFLRDPRVLPLFGRHHQTGQPLPWESLDAHLRAQRSLRHLEERDELLLALLDQRLHLRRDDDASFDSTSVYERAQEEVGILPAVYGLDWQARFSHLVSYPASYYSYPLDRTLAAALWQHLFAQDPLSRENGSQYKYKMLAAGGARDAYSLVQELLPSWDELR